MELSSVGALKAKAVCDSPQLYHKGEGDTWMRAEDSEWICC